MSEENEGAYTHTYIRIHKERISLIFWLDLFPYRKGNCPAHHGRSLALSTAGEEEYREEEKKRRKKRKEEKKVEEGEIENEKK